MRWQMCDHHFYTDTAEIGEPYNFQEDVDEELNCSCIGRGKGKESLDFPRLPSIHVLAQKQKECRSFSTGHQAQDKKIVPRGRARLLQQYTEMSRIYKNQQAKRSVTPKFPALPKLNKSGTDKEQRVPQLEKFSDSDSDETCSKTSTNLPDKPTMTSSIHDTRERRDNVRLEQVSIRTNDSPKSPQSQPASSPDTLFQNSPNSLPQCSQLNFPDPPRISSPPNSNNNAIGNDLYVRFRPHSPPSLQYIPSNLPMNMPSFRPPYSVGSLSNAHNPLNVPHLIYIPVLLPPQFDLSYNSTSSSLLNYMSLIFPYLFFPQMNGQ